MPGLVFFLFVLNCKAFFFNCLHLFKPLLEWEEYYHLIPFPCIKRDREKDFLDSGLQGKQ